MHNDPNPTASFSEPEAQQILARAAEIEGTTGTRFSLEDLRQIAVRAGIDEAALHHAINERRATDLPAVTHDASGGMNPGDIATLAAAGAVLGALAMAADNVNLLGSSALPVFAPSALFTIHRALTHPLRKGFGGLLRDLGIVFGAFTVAIGATQGFDSASVATTWSLMVGALGCGILALRGAQPGSSAPQVAPTDNR